MNKNNKKISLNEMLLLKIRSLYEVERQLVKALPKVAKNSSNSELKQAIKDHLEETKGHVQRLEEIFKILEVKPKKIEVDAIRGLVSDTEWVIKNIKDKPAKDTGLIASAQYVEHYEIAGYGSALEWATLLGLERPAELLEETLGEEKAADEKLTGLAKSKINQAAVSIET